MNKKIKAFYKKHEDTIKFAGLALIPITLTAVAVVMIKKIDDNMTKDDDLTDEEWDHLLDLSRQMDEYVAERKALKSQ